MTETMACSVSRLTIGEVARRAGCKVETIRYYERVGVLPAPPRTTGGHRLYGRAHLKRLVFVRRSRELGFGLSAIGGLLDLAEGGTKTCADVKTLTLQHVDEVRCRITDLKKMERALRGMARRCAGGEASDCPVIDALYGDSH